LTVGLFDKVMRGWLLGRDQYRKQEAYRVIFELWIELVPPLIC
jgi:hypothetical protein